MLSVAERRRLAHEVEAHRLTAEELLVELRGLLVVGQPVPEDAVLAVIDRMKVNMFDLKAKADRLMARNDAPAPSALAQ